MESTLTEKLKKEITPKVKKGDYTLLSEMLGIPQETARKRFHRENPEAVEAMSKIIEAREQLIKSYTEQ